MCGVEIPMGLEASKGGFKFELVSCDLGNKAYHNQKKNVTENNINYN